jgi:ribulose-phosphate 3-epimerase
MVKIYPSLMAADQLNLAHAVQSLNEYCAGFHLDVMDNHFVPNITWGAATVNAIATLSNVWVHLMIDNPMSFYEQLVLKPDSLVSFHIESGIDFFEVIKIVREKKHRLSITISPKTPVLRIVPFLDIVDQVLLMSVEPGFSGQPFLTSTFDRLDELIAYRQEYAGLWKIGIDGGVNATNIVQLVEKGVDDCAVGGGIFQQQNPLAALQELQRLIAE